MSAPAPKKARTGEQHLFVVKSLTDHLKKRGRGSSERLKQVLDEGIEMLQASEKLRGESKEHGFLVLRDKNAAPAVALVASRAVDAAIDQVPATQRVSCPPDFVLFYIKAFLDGLTGC